MDVRRQPYLTGVLLSSLLLGWVGASSVQAAEKPPTPAQLAEKYGLQAGMIVNQSNADLIKDLIPDAAYERLKRGEYVFQIGQLESPDLFEKIWDQQYNEGTKANVGKYDVDENGGIIDANGERPWPMPYGLPFPNLDPEAEDPVKAGAKIIWNVYSMPGACNEQDHDNARLVSAPAMGTFDRFFSPKVLRQYVDFRRNPAKNTNRPVMFQEIFFFLEPADAFGGSNLTWRWSDPTKWDSVWNYSPSTRRVRRLTAANRSDAILGTEVVQDDGTPGYNGKIEMMNWKYIGKKDMLMPIPRRWDQQDDDFVAHMLTYQAAHSTSKAYSHVPGSFQQGYKKTTFGFQQEPQQYASWWIPDLLWIPVPTYIVEAMPNDPYYNIGKQIFYFEQATGLSTWKEIFNRAGEYWRTTFLLFEFPRFHDPEVGHEVVCLDGTAGILVDDKINRGSVGLDTGDNLRGRMFGGATVHYNTGLGGDAFDLSRFLQYGK